MRTKAHDIDSNTGRRADPFSANALRRFRAALVHVFTRDLGMSRGESEDHASDFSEILRANHEDGLATVARRLDQSGIRTQWNHVLYERRPAALTSWILPHCRGKLLDLLCGDGRVGECLATRGVRVTLTERLESYSVTRAHAVPFLEFDTLQQACGRRPSFSTILLCTVLHHEKAPDEVLRLASALCRGRLIIVENCLESRFPADAHLLLDLFFSRSLNTFTLPAAGNHASAKRWMTHLSTLGGRVRVHERSRFLPGIPLSHDLIVVDVDRRAS
jgi:SAM-dependent methyltransferase